MSTQVVSVASERARTMELARIHDANVPLPLAAAIAFFQVHGDTTAQIARQDYDDALDIAAAALSRLMPIYAMSDGRDGPVPIAVDLAGQRFARGATELRLRNGTAIRELSIRRADMHSAIALIKRAGLPLL